MSDQQRPVYDASHTARTYSSALLDASGRVPDDLVDWDAFHTRLVARAELSLTRLRHPTVASAAPARPRPADLADAPLTVPWWTPAARWSRLVVTASVAAGIALVMVVRASPKDAADTVIASAAPSPDQTDRQRAAFESVALGRGTTGAIESAFLPSAADLLVPLGKGAAPQ